MPKDLNPNEKGFDQSYQYRTGGCTVFLPVLVRIGTGVLVYRFGFIGIFETFLIYIHIYEKYSNKIKCNTFKLKYQTFINYIKCFKCKINKIKFNTLNNQIFNPNHYQASTNY